MKPKIEKKKIIKKLLDSTLNKRSISPLCALVILKQLAAKKRPR